jgi:hypothetical protein
MAAVLGCAVLRAGLKGCTEGVTIPRDGEVLATHLGHHLDPFGRLPRLGVQLGRLGAAFVSRRIVNVPVDVPPGVEEALRVLVLDVGQGQVLGPRRVLR